MAINEKTATYGESALRALKLPSGHDLAFANDEQLEAYWLLAQALKYLGKQQTLRTWLSNKLPLATETLRKRWPELPAGAPDAQNYPSWIESLRILTSTDILANRPPMTSGITNYFYQVALLTDLASLDRLADEDLVPVNLPRLRTAPPPLRGDDSPEQAVLMFCTKQGKRRTALLRLSLTSDPATGSYALASPPDLGISRPAFYTSTGDPRGDFSEEDLGSILLAPFTAAQTADWPAFMEALDTRCQDLTGGGLLELPQRLFGTYAANLSAFLIDAEKLKSEGLAKIFAPIVGGQRKAPLLDAIFAGEGKPATVTLRTAPRDLFLGHMDEQTPSGRSGFPLDPTQRLAAMTAVAMGGQSHAAPILPVNGPPGTGKTSFLRAVLASMWVRSAYEAAPNPPLVVGTGFTNKAVSNVIGAFSSVASATGEGITGRWLDGLPSYGWLFPSQAARERYPELMHLLYESKAELYFAPAGGAAEFAETPLSTHLATYCVRAASALRLPQGSAPTCADIVANLHRRIVAGVDHLRDQQAKFKKSLQTLYGARELAQGTAAQVLSWREQVATLAADATRLRRTQTLLTDALSAAGHCVEQQLELEQGLTRWVRMILGNWLYRDKLRDLGLLEEKAAQAVAATSIIWPGTLRERQALMETLRSRRREVTESLRICDQRLAEAEAHLSSISGRRADWRTAVQAVMDRLHHPETPAPGETTNIRYLLHAARSRKGGARHQAEDMLWQRFDALQDIQLRFELFHLSARYWEGRWLLAQSSSTTEQPSKKEILSRLMMLGVVIVSTTHKLPTIGNSATIDLLVFDEAGQCSPEIGAAMLSFSASALLVGDLKQLQPIAGLTVEQSQHLAKTLDINLPTAFCAARGSAMALARYVTPFTDGVDSSGITLLYHYRCHPKIIGYCNRLLYANQIRCVRGDKPTPAQLPAMSWVGVQGMPTRVGHSWANTAELEEIVRWIREHHQRLTDAYRKPLDKVLAIITPLKAQAEQAKNLIPTMLADIIPAETLKAMTIGTVHSLQGAECPVVAFSLVQQRTTGDLFAERDGGFLMNVAVSRAKDAFIVFGDRDALRPGPLDKPQASQQERQPIGQLGAYLRKFGQRLYPRRLVVVEAPNKVQKIAQILGTDCAVVASGGYLTEISLQPDGHFDWSSPPAEFLAEIRLHARLVDDLLIATDDDLAGELIGVQVAEAAAPILGDIPVRRMRFHSLEATNLRDALAVAGSRFDSNLLAAALLREAMRGLDRQRYERLLPNAPYIGPAERATVALVAALDDDERVSVELLLEDDKGRQLPGYVAADRAVLASPLGMDGITGAKLADDLKNMVADVAHRGRIARVPELYPPSTTQRILAAAADELGMMPWEAQDHLNAMYQAGAAAE